MIKPGRYRHYRGGIYVVLFTATDSETNKPTVVYMNEAHGTYYVRSLKEFTSDVDMDEQQIPRFKPLDK